MIECQNLGLAKSIGVSNFNRRQLQTLIDHSSVTPANLQVCVCVLCLVYHTTTVNLQD